MRFITHNVQLKLVVIALVESVSAIVNVLIVVLLIWLTKLIIVLNCYILRLMFAILGISLMQGKMEFCKDQSIEVPTVYQYYGVSRAEVIKQFIFITFFLI